MAIKGKDSSRRSPEVARLMVSHRDFLTELKKNASDDGAMPPFKKGGPEYALLLELLRPLYADQLDEVSDNRRLAVGTSFQEIGALLDEVLAGAAPAATRTKFLTGVTRSPVFYGRVIKKLREVTPELVDREIPGFDKILQRSDAELYQKVEDVLRDGQGEVVASGRAVSDWSRHRRPLWLRPVFAGSTAACLVAVALFLLWPGKADRFADYTYGKSVPFDSDTVSELRGGVLESVWTREQLSFRNKLNDALADYHVREFGPAVQSLTWLASTPEMRNLDRADSVWVKLSRKLNFYLGISSFAHARSPSRDLNEAESAALMKSALTCLEKAETLAFSGDSTIEREFYFIALVQAVAGDLQSSREYLQKIPKNSDFFDRKNELLQRLAMP